jgi:parallel beta-helix repeat protein
VNDLTNALNLAKTVKAFNETIIINADGSKSPSTAPIYTADNVTYTLTNNVTVNGDGIGIERDNIILDGAGFTLTGRDSGLGMWLFGRNNVTVGNMTITNFRIGIELGFAEDFPTASTGNSSVYNTLLGSNIVNNGGGIVLGRAHHNALLGNNVTANNLFGINVFRSDSNTLSGNTVANSGEGIILTFSSYNTIYHNYFINNTSQVISTYTDNIWDDGSKGNYWSDYLTKYPNATQVDSSGVWNTPYVIGDVNNTDHYPLMTQYLVPEFPSFLILPLFLTATLLTAMICKKRQTKDNLTLPFSGLSHAIEKSLICTATKDELARA